MISSVEARVHVHATESREKVLKALLEVFPQELRGFVSVERELLEGHYGNPIEVLTATLSIRAEEVLKHLISRLSERDGQLLRATLEDRVDRGGDLYLRISKQEAFLGRIVLEDSDDVVRVRFNFSGRREEALELYGGVLGST